MHKPGHKFLSRLGAALTLIGGLLVATALGGVSPAGAATQWTPLTLCGVMDSTTAPAGTVALDIIAVGDRKSVV